MDATRHFRILGWILLIIGSVWILGAVFLLVMFADVPEAQFQIFGCYPVLLCGMFVVISAAGLLGRKPWGRRLAIVASVLMLVPMGPFFPPAGIYGLWVTLRRGARAGWDDHVQRRKP